MTVAADPLGKWGVQDRMQQAGGGGAMGVVAAQATGAAGGKAAVALAESRAIGPVALQAELPVVNRQQVGLLAAVALVAIGTAPAGRGVGKAFLPVGRGLLVAVEAQFRLLAQQMVFLAAAVGRVAAGAVTLSQQRVGMRLLLLPPDRLVAGQAGLAGGPALDKGVIGRVGSVTVQANAVPIRGMTAGRCREGVGRGMALPAQGAARGRPGQQGRLRGLVRIVALAALAAGKRRVQAEQGQLIIELLVTFQAEQAVGLGQQLPLRRLVGLVAKIALLRRRRRVCPRSAAVVALGVAGGTQRRRLGLQLPRRRRRVFLVALKTPAVADGGMVAAGGMVGGAGIVALQAQATGRLLQQRRLVGGMGVVALEAIAVAAGGVVAARPVVGIVALPAELSGVRFRPAQLAVGDLMAAVAFTPAHRFVNPGPHQAGAVSSVGFMAGQAVVRYLITVVPLQLGALFGGVAGEAERGGGLAQQRRLVAVVRLVAAQALLRRRQGGMLYRFAKWRLFMAPETEVGADGGQQLRVVAVVRVVAAAAVAPPQRWMAARGVGYRRPLLLVALQAEAGLRLAQMGAADYPVGQVTSGAPVLGHRGVGMAPGKGGAFFGMAIDTGLALGGALLVRRAVLPAGGQQECRQGDKQDQRRQVGAINCCSFHGSPTPGAGVARPVD